MSEAHTTQNQCPRCLFLHDPDDRYCRQCGKRLFAMFDELNILQQVQVIADLEEIIDRYLQDSLTSNTDQ